MIDDYRGADSADAPEAKRIKAAELPRDYRRFLKRQGPMVVTRRPSLLGSPGLLLR